MKIHEDVLQLLWELTKPNSPIKANKYLHALYNLIKIPKIEWHEMGFLREKKEPGKYRRIIPAKNELKVVLLFLKDWFKRIFPQEYDWSNHGDVKTARMHTHSTCGIAIDLQAAYEHVTASKLKFFLQTYWPAYQRKDKAKISDQVINLLVYLLTYEEIETIQKQEGYCPQGLSTSSFAFNLVALNLDKQLEIIVKSLRQSQQDVVVLTRYRDDILLTFLRPKDRQFLEKLEYQIKSLIIGCRFTPGRTSNYEQPPFRYLGLEIGGGKIEPFREYIDKVENLLREIIKKDEAEAKKVHDTITGHYTTLRKYYKDRSIPDNLLHLFQKYYELVGKPPKSFSAELNRRFKIFHH